MIFREYDVLVLEKYEMIREGDAKEGLGFWA